MADPTTNRTPRLRVGAVSYLNTKPLVYRLAERSPEVELVFDVPSRLADALTAAELDVALIPSIEYLQHPAYTIVSDACIACRGPVLSVKLLSRRPMAQIRTLALDEGSRTSGILARILLDQRFGLRPELCPLPIGQDAAGIAADAVLLIGDRAIHPPTAAGFVEAWDLGDEWCRWAELPFVFAMWVAREGVAWHGLDETLAAARDDGVAHLEDIAVQEAAAVGLTPRQTLTYLRDHLHFYFGTPERRGLELYDRYAQRLETAETMDAAPRGRPAARTMIGVADD